MNLNARLFYQERLERLRHQLGDGSAIIAAGRPASRNFPANRYPFRASSHFLYFVGQSIAGALLTVGPEGAKLHVPRPTDSDRLWHGEGTDLTAITTRIGVAVGYVDQLPDVATAMTIPCMDYETNLALTKRLGRPIEKGTVHAYDEPLASAMVTLRLCHDELAIQEIRKAASATTDAHRVALQHIEPGVSCQRIWALMQAEFDPESHYQ